ncbi:hypothetical protein Taro_046905 [Colocasia esculenta]|uniref:Uncharacterized protein n=1 Tax=Colocasia esculenta TaxID=4460 RepID=A0A843WUW5_COLES|nr:hypothetical protein [Colocasia esculenta]
MVELRSGRRVETEEIPSASGVRVDMSRGRTPERLKAAVPPALPPPRVREFRNPAKQRSEVNRKNKGVQKIFHCAGTQTFAGICKAEGLLFCWKLLNRAVAVDSRVCETGIMLASRCSCCALVVIHLGTAVLGGGLLRILFQGMGLPYLMFTGRLTRW